MFGQGEYVNAEHATKVIHELRRNLRHWRDECGKLHSQIERLKADLRAWEITVKRIEKADPADPAEPVAYRWYFNGNWYFGERPAPQGYPSTPLYDRPETTSTVSSKGCE